MANFKVKELTGIVDIFGVERTFEFSGSTLTISGVGSDDVSAIFSSLPNGKPMSLHGSDTVKAPTEPNPFHEDVQRVRIESAKTNGNGSSTKTSTKIMGSSTPNARIVNEDKEISKETNTSISNADITKVDISGPLATAKGLRDVVGILLDQTKNPDELVKLCSSLRDSVPALKSVEVATLDTRVRRIAGVLSGEQQ